MEILTIWPHIATKGGLDEKCLWSTKGYYVGLKTGTHYAAADYYHSPQLRAIIRAVDATNQTGMYHLDEHWQEEDKKDDNRAKWKQQFVGCLVTVENAHNCGDRTIYRCLELDEYFSANELELIDPQ